MGAGGCGLGVSGLGPDVHADAGSGWDAGLEAHAASLPEAGEATEAAPPSDAPAEAATPCSESPPPGWSAAYYEPLRGACPSGTTSHDVVTGGDAGAGACTCACSVTSAVGCETGTLQLAGGTASTCGGATTSVGVASEFCAPLSATMTMPAYMAVAALPPSGTCSATATAHPGTVAEDDVRWCEVGDAGEPAGACGAAAPSGFSACIAHPGDVACPGAGPFTARVVVADDFSLTCSACSCAVTGSCGRATVAFFSDQSCNDSIIGLDADGTCDPTEVANASVGSILYNASVTQAGSCTAGGSTPVVAPSGTTTTLCCLGNPVQIVP